MENNNFELLPKNPIRWNQLEFPNAEQYKQEIQHTNTY